MNLFRKVTTRDGEVDLWCEIPAGSGWIGSPETEAGRQEREGPRHRIEVRRTYWLMAVPVTCAMYAAKDPSRFDPEKADHPIVDVTWDEAMDFCRWLAEAQGLEGARLPTEEEWEFACRAGSETRYWNGDAESDLAQIGWYDQNSNDSTHPVGEKPANPRGLYDVHGNVLEWTASPWQSDYSVRGAGLSIDPLVEPEDLAETAIAGHAFRGGCYAVTAAGARSAARWFRPSKLRWWDLGFRVLLPHPPA